MPHDLVGAEQPGRARGGVARDRRHAEQRRRLTAHLGRPAARRFLLAGEQCPQGAIAQGRALIAVSLAHAAGNVRRVTLARPAHEQLLSARARCIIRPGAATPTALGIG